jgi:hypothetical protein
MSLDSRQVIGNADPNVEYPFAKYNKKVELIMYNDEEYTSLVEPLDPSW